MPINGDLCWLTGFYSLWVKPVGLMNTNNVIGQNIISYRSHYAVLCIGYAQKSSCNSDLPLFPQNLVNYFLNYRFLYKKHSLITISYDFIDVNLL